MGQVGTSKILTDSGYQTLADLNTAGAAFNAVNMRGEVIPVGAPIAVSNKKAVNVSLKNGQVVTAEPTHSLLVAVDREKNTHEFKPITSLAATDYLVRYGSGEEDFNTKLVDHPDTKVWEYVQVSAIATVSSPSSQTVYDLVSFLGKEYLDGGFVVKMEGAFAGEFVAETTDSGVGGTYHPTMSFRLNAPAPNPYKMYVSYTSPFISAPTVLDVPSGATEVEFVATSAAVTQSENATISAQLITPEGQVTIEEVLALTTA